MGEINIPMADQKANAAVMGETLAAMHWIGGLDGRDVATCHDQQQGPVEIP